MASRESVAGFIRRRLKALGISAVELSRRLGHKSNSTVGSILAPSNTEPFKFWRDAETWANVLELTGEERHQFYDLVLLEAAPPFIAQAFRELADDYAKLTKEADELRTALLREVKLRHLSGTLQAPPPGRGKRGG